MNIFRRMLVSLASTVGCWQGSETDLLEERG